MARSYLVAALASGVVIGYIIARVEAHHEINAITQTVNSSHNLSSAPTDATSQATASLLNTLFKFEQPIDDLERAARRLDDRARSADRLGDPKLADLWRAEAEKLRATSRSRTAAVTESSPLSE